MKTLHTQNRIIELMARFVAQVKGFSALSRTDINHVAESFLVPLFREVYDLPTLKNLNVEDTNYPGVDLGDEEARVAFQITSTSDGEKVKHTLEKVIEHSLYEKYDRIIVYILTEKQKSYSAKPFYDILTRLPGHAIDFAFDKDRDILDHTDLLCEITNLPLGKQVIIERLLEENLGDGVPALFDRATTAPATEPVFLNLLELSFPDTLYVADLAVEIEDNKNEDDWQKRRRRRRTRRRKSSADQVREALQAQGLKFSADWICHAKQIITFHDLRDRNLPLTSVIDPGTVTPLHPDEYFTIDGEIDDNLERVFKSLLRKCLQQKLYQRDVCWQNEENLFIFSEVDGRPKRREEWFGKKKSERVVFERTMKNNKPDEILHCKHLAFGVQFRCYGSHWYVVITPDWFFSFDGYKPSFYGADKITWLKKKENNYQVYNHVRFLAHFLKNDAPSNLFMQSQPYSFLKFGELVSFNNAPALNDKDWLPGESEDTKKRLQQSDDDTTASFEMDEE